MGMEACPGPNIYPNHWFLIAFHARVFIGGKYFSSFLFSLLNDL